MLQGFNTELAPEWAPCKPVPQGPFQMLSPSFWLTFKLSLLPAAENFCPSTAQLECVADVYVSIVLDGENMSLFIGDAM